MKWIKQLPKVFGGRIFKTALAAYITAYVCEWLGWPPLFAVMTSVVTIEPTSVDSIRKGLIRFPASIIGAGYAMLFVSLFNHSALTYSLAATLTLFSCCKLKLHDGLIVATLTAIAMVSVTYDHYLSSFFIRMGTTFTGITVSSLINYFVFPPKYIPLINRQVIGLYHETGQFLETCLNNLKENHRELNRDYEKLSKKLDMAFQLIHFQRAEWAYHKHPTSGLRELYANQRKLEHLQRVMYHIGNLIYQKVPEGLLKKEEYQLILKVGHSLLGIFCHFGEPISSQHFELIDQLALKFHAAKDQAAQEGEAYHHHFSPKLVVMYELLALHDVMEELNRQSERLLNINASEKEECYGSKSYV